MSCRSWNNCFTVEGPSWDTLLNEIRNLDNFINNSFDVSVDVEEERLQFFDDLDPQRSLDNFFIASKFKYFSFLMDSLDDAFHD